MSQSPKLGRDQPVPAEFAGKWVAWDATHERIIASAATMSEVWKLARETGEQNPIYEKVPQLDVRFVGSS